VNGPRTGWQTLLADLSLVLFMITAGALGRARMDRSVQKPALAPPSPAPLAIYRDTPGAPPLDRWLAAQPGDARQRLTIVARYPPGSEERVPDRVAASLSASTRAGAHPRILIEPGGVGTSAGIGFDAGAGEVAQVLLQQSGNAPPRKPP